MNSYKSSSELKYLAKTQMYGRLGTVIGAFLLHMALFLAVIYLSEFINISTLTGTVIYLVVGILIDLFGDMLTTGDNYLYLKLASGQDAVAGDVLFGLKTMPAKIAKVKFIPVLLVNLAAIPGFLLMKSLMVSMPSADAMMNMIREGRIDEYVQLSYELAPAVMTFLGVKIVELLFTLAMDIVFSQTLFFMLDYPEYSVIDTLRYSVGIIKKNWGRYLYIKLSFIPWFFLGILTWYMAFLWVYPYYRATMANLYLDIIKNNNQEKTYGYNS